MTQRRSDKHTRRIDEGLDHDTASVTHGAPVEARSRDDLRQEDPTEEGGTTSDVPGAPRGMTAEEVDLRAELARCLRPSVFPARRDRLVEVAGEEGAPDAILDALRHLPESRRFEVLEQVSEAIGEHGEAGRP